MVKLNISKYFRRSPGRTFRMSKSLLGMVDNGKEVSLNIQPRRSMQEIIDVSKDNKLLLGIFYGRDSIFIPVRDGNDAMKTLEREMKRGNIVGAELFNEDDKITAIAEIDIEIEIEDN